MNGPPPTADLSVGLYVHFPFCAHVCHYCDYAVEAAARPPVETWLETVGRELDLRFRREGWEAPPELETVYVGGGTPSLMGASGMEELASLLAARFRLAGAGFEWTAEANPASLDRSTAEGWREAGVTRLSLGIQSLDDRALRWLGRLHDARAARAAVEIARQAGFRDLNADLLYGLPAEVSRAWGRDLARVRDLGVAHVTLYGLTVETGTPLARWMDEGRVSAAGEERLARAYLRASRDLSAAGWEHYEVAGLARPGRRWRHGLRYWAGEPTLGVGPSAHGYLPPRRFRNVFQWDEYRYSVMSGALPVADAERLERSDRRTERIWLALRTRDGVTGDLARRLRRCAPELVARMIREGWLRAGTPAVAPTPEGWLRIDDLATALASALDRPASAAAVRTAEDAATRSRKRDRRGSTH